MLRNNNTILSNEGKIIKSQAVDSYLSSTESYYMQWTMTLSGVTPDNPFKYYVQQPDNLVKKVYTSDITEQIILISPTSESSEKPIYTFGNLDAVIQLEYSDGNYNKKGDLFGFINQFKNLELFKIQSTFNSDISYIKLPKNLKKFEITDQTVYGNVETFQNMDNIEELKFDFCDFIGDITKLNIPKLNHIYFNSCFSLYGDIEKIFNYPLNYLSIDNVNNIYGDISNNIINKSGLTYLYLQVSNNSNIYGDIGNCTQDNTLEYFHFNLPTNSNVVGNISGWTFSDNLYYFYLYLNNYVTGDITNWDFSNTKLEDFYLYGIQNYKSNIIGNLSNWILPNTLDYFRMYYTDITNIPNDLSNTSLRYFYLYYCDEITTISGTTFPDTIVYIYLYQNDNLSDDVGNWDFNDNLIVLNISYCSLIYGDIGNLTIPTNLETLQLNNTQLTGYLSGVTFTNNLQTISLANNNLIGNITNITVPPSLRNLQLNGNNLYIDFGEGTFNTSGITSINLSSNSGITGDITNLIIGDSLDYLYLNYTPIYSNLTNFILPNSIRYVYMYGCQINSNITNLLHSGTTNLYYLYLYDNINMSGDTSNWYINNITQCEIYNTGLSGKLKHNNVYNLRIYNTNINSNIVEDFNLSNRCYYFEAQNSAIWGNLSGITLYNNFYYFYIHDNSGVTGSNEFIDYLFINRKNFIYNTPRINISNIGDTVIGIEQLGDLGTWSGDENDLTEEQVNNLVDGTDYDGNGSNTSWSQAEKIYWMKNATISSSSSTKRYVNYQIIY